MSNDVPDLRQRKAAPEPAPRPTPAPTKTVTASQADADDDPYSPWVDALRVLTFLLVASCGLSYVISGGESWAWGAPVRAPSYLRPAWWRAKLSGPLYLTLDELAAYDGHDPTKPLYLSVNGTVYDVSKGQHMYGPGASYHAFAGRDSSRAFITTCLEGDNIPDVRGAEEAFLPLDDPETDAHWTTAEMAELRAQELVAARQRAHAALKNWVDFFANSDKYHRVGYLNWDAAELENRPRRELCEKAQKSRVKRDPSNRR